MTQLLFPQEVSTSRKASVRKITPPIQTVDNQPIKGFLIAVTILVLWFVSLVVLLPLNIFVHSPLVIGIALFWQSFLYTGLFITAHDAMHGAVVPGHPKINNAIGALALLCYGFFSYQELLRKHWLHHKYPGTELDPDFHRDGKTSFGGWYFQFMKHYWSWTRIAALLLLLGSIHYCLGVSPLNLALFLVIPSVTSSVQLFYFGTFLTHRELEGGYQNCHRTQSTAFPTLWSFLTCYHFGYHEEHHEYPHVPWWQLPGVYRSRQQHRSRQLNEWDGRG
ncbi:MAG: beta-carotene ketolase CrtW [Leptolyngbya sp. BL-A-14]